MNEIELLESRFLKNSIEYNGAAENFTGSKSANPILYRQSPLTNFQIEHTMFFLIG